MNLSIIPTKIDTIHFHLKNQLKEYELKQLIQQKNGTFLRKFESFEIYYDPLSYFLMIKIFSLPRMLYGYSQIEFLESSHTTIILISNIISSESGINLTFDELKFAKVSEYHLNKDIYFSSKKSAYAFLEWLRAFDTSCKGKKFKMDYNSSTRIGNNSWGLSVYEKILQCNDKKKNYILLENCKYCIRIELQLKKQKLNKANKLIIKDYTLSTLLKEEAINEIWHFFVNNKKCICDNILSPYFLKKHINESNYRSTTKSKQLMYNVLIKARTKGLQKMLKENSQMRYYINCLLLENICPLPLDLHILKELKKCNKNRTNFRTYTY